MTFYAKVVSVNHVCKCVKQKFSNVAGLYQILDIFTDKKVSYLVFFFRELEKKFFYLAKFLVNVGSRFADEAQLLRVVGPMIPRTINL